MWVALIALGMIDAALSPHPHTPAPESTPVSGPHQPDGGIAAPSARDIAAQRAAIQFVTATDTTDPAHPFGDTATQAALGLPLVPPGQAAWPVAWITQDRHTTVRLDRPGPALAQPDGQVIVIVTGEMTVNSDGAPPEKVPVVERVTLLAVPGGRVSGRRVLSAWLVTAAEAGP